MNEQYFTSLNGYYVKDKEAIHTYDSVAEMKNDSKIKEGSYVKTRGYYNVNDGGNGEYIIRTKNQDDVEDNGSIHFVQNNLVAELIIKDNLNVKLFGAKGDGITDDTQIIQNCLNKYKIVNLPVGTYLISNIVIKKNQSLIGENTNTILKSISNNTNDYLVETDSNSNNCVIKNLIIDGNNNVNTCLYLNRNSGTIDEQYDCKYILDNLFIKNAIQVGLYVTSNVRETRFLNLDVAHNGTRGIYLRGTDNMFINCSSHSNGEDGFYITGSNNKIVNSKAFMNGLSGTNQTIPAGITIRGILNTITSCEVQENIFDGFKIEGSMNTITGCIIDSNGSTEGDIDYQYSAGIHLISVSDLPYNPNFNIITGNTISSGHVTGNQKYGILIEDGVKNNYVRHPSYNVIDVVCNEDERFISSSQIFQDLINLSDYIPNISNNIKINGNNQYNVETSDLTGLELTYYNSDVEHFKIDNVTLSNGKDLKLETDTYVNASVNTSSSAIYTIFSGNGSEGDYGVPKGLIVKYKLKTNNKNILPSVNVYGSYWNDNTFTDKTYFTSAEQELYTSSTLSTEYRDCVSILDMRRFDNKQLDRLALYFKLKVLNQITEDVGTIEVDVKDIEYYLFY